MQGDRVLPQLLVGSGVLRQGQHATAPVDHRDLLGHEVHAVRQRVDQDHVADRVGGHREREVLRHPQVDGLPAVLGVPGVDLRHHRADQRDVVGVLGHVGAAGLKQGEEADLADELRMLVEQCAEGQEAPHDVLARVGAVHPQNQLPLPVQEGVPQHGDVPGDVLGAQRRLQGGGVHRDRVVAGPHDPVVDEHQQIVQVDVQAEQVLGAQDEVAGVAPGVEADDVAAEQAAQQPFPDTGRQDPPLVRPRPRDVDEMGEHDVRAQLADPLGHQVEVIVLQQDQRLATAGANLVDDRVRVHAVDRRVAVLERVVLGQGDDG